MVTFLFASVALDIAQVLGFVFILLCYLGDIDLNGWMAFSLFFLALFGARSLSLRLISRKKRVIELSFFFIPVSSLIVLLPIDIVLVFLDRRLVFFRALGIDFSSPKRWLKACFCFCIDNFFYHLFLRIQIPLLIVQLSLNR